MRVLTGGVGSRAHGSASQRVAGAALLWWVGWGRGRSSPLTWHLTPALGAPFPCPAGPTSPWRYTFSDWVEEDMSVPRVMGDATLLPNGDVVLLNGAQVRTRALELASCLVSRRV